MKNRPKWRTFCCFTIVLPMVVLVAYSFYIVADPFVPVSCVDKIQQEIPSPDGASVATVFDRSCGDGTSGSSRMVLMRDAKIPLQMSGGGEIKFRHKTIEPGREQDVVLVMDGQRRMVLNWRSSDDLEVTVSGGEKLKKLTSWGKVRISYKG